MKKNYSNDPKFDSFELTPTTPATLAATVAAAMTPTQLSSDQRAAFDSVMAWIRDAHKPFLTLGGLAGTGKTTLVSTIASEVGAASVAFCAFTGKAASVLGRKLREVGVLAGATTIHKLIYQPVRGTDPLTGAVSVTWQRKPELSGVQLIVVDEASMLSAELWDDLRSFGIPILAVGDHGQLPPVGGDNPKLMEHLDLRLEVIHRQAAGNPIIQLAHHVRSGAPLRKFALPANDARVLFAKSAIDALNILGGKEAVGRNVLQIGLICGKNSTRARLNGAIRDLLGFSGNAPDPGETVIALRNFPPVFNGLRGTFVGPIKSGYAGISNYGAFPGRVDFPDDNFYIEGDINRHQFGAEKTFGMPSDIPATVRPSSWRQAGLLFDWGYALTCHKAQGSQFDQAVVLSNDLFGDSDFRKRWLYTAVTRAAKQLILV